MNGTIRLANTVKNNGASRQRLLELPQCLLATDTLIAGAERPARLLIDLMFHNKMSHDAALPLVCVEDYVPSSRAVVASAQSRPSGSSAAGASVVLMVDPTWSEVVSHTPHPSQD